MRYKDMKTGEWITWRGDCDCLTPERQYQVKEDDGGKFVTCKRGSHYLDSDGDPDQEQLEWLKRMGADSIVRALREGSLTLWDEGDKAIVSDLILLLSDAKLKEYLVFLEQAVDEVIPRSDVAIGAVAWFTKLMEAMK